MINSQKSFNLHSYIDIFLKRIWYFIIPLVLVVSGTVAYLITTPKWYRSSTLVLVSPQKIPQDYVKATVTSIGGRPAPIHCPGDPEPDPPGAGDFGV